MIDAEEVAPEPSSVSASVSPIALLTRRGIAEAAVVSVAGIAFPDRPANSNRAADLRDRGASLPGLLVSRRAYGPLDACTTPARTQVATAGPEVEPIATSGVTASAPVTETF